MNIRGIVLLCMCLIAGSSYAQQPGFSPDGYEPQTSPIRRFLSKFSFNAQIGYGRTFYAHDIGNMAILRDGENFLITSENNPGIGNSIQAYQFWMNDPQAVTVVYNVDDDFASSETFSNRLIGKGNNIPMTFSIHYTFMEKFRLGGGATFELHSIANVIPKNADADFGKYNSNYGSSLFKRYFGYAGYKFLEFRGWSNYAEIKIGAHMPGKQYSNALIKKGMFFDIGVSIERDLSEYFRWTFRPSIEMKSYTLAFSEIPSGLKHKMVTPYITTGISYSIPDLKRCPLKKCHVQINHVHGGKEYRSRRHPIFKKQNPNYGENYPRLNQDTSRKKKLF